MCTVTLKGKYKKNIIEFYIIILWASLIKSPYSVEMVCMRKSKQFIEICRSVFKYFSDSATYFHIFRFSHTYTKAYNPNQS